MIAPVNSFVVRAVEPRTNTVLHEQEFYVTGPAADPDADVKARRHRERIASLYPFADVTITPSSAPTEERPTA